MEREPASLLGNARLWFLRAALSATLLVLPGALEAQDCNRNGIPDALDLSPRLGFEATLVLGGTGSVAAGDLDGDGKVDLAGTSAEGFRTLLNRGSSEFSVSLTGPAGNNLGSSPALADLDGDGDLDAAVVYPLLTTLRLFTNDGNGRLASGDSMASRFLATEIVAADLEGDQDADLIIGFGRADSLGILHNRGNGRFDAMESVLLAFDEILHPIAEDLDGDGRIDLAAATEDGGVHLRLNDGQGGFAPRGYFFGPGFTKAIVPADVEGDGDLDLVLAAWFSGATGFASVLKNDGMANFELAINYEIGPDATSVVALDADGDGAPDFAIGQSGRDSGSSTVELLRNVGDGTLTPPVAYTAGQSDLRLAAADLDGDGRPEIVSSGAVLSVLRNDGKGSFHATVTLNTRLPAKVACAADLDGDGQTDLALGQEFTGQVSAFLNNGGGAWTEAGSASTRGDPQSIAAGDLDGDGKPDVALASLVDYPKTSGAVFVVPNPGDGSFSKPGEIPVGKKVFSLALHDLDLDGDLDLAVSADRAVPGEAPDLLVFLNGGQGNFGPGPTVEGADFARVIYPADVDGDGKSDLVTVGLRAISGAALYRNAGGAGFRSPETIIADSWLWALAVGEIDGDGAPDLAAVQYRQGSSGPVDLLVLRNDGRGSFTVGSRRPLPGAAMWIALPDLDGDGARDVATLVSDWGTMQVFRNDGRGGLAEAGLFFAGRAPAGILAADLDGDGKPDLLSPVPGSRELAVFLNSPRPPTSRDADADGIPDECGPLFHRGDPDGDGAVNISDGITVLSSLFTGGDPPACLESADADNGGAVDLSDAVFLLSFLFLGGPSPAAPGPPGGPCGPDPDVRGSAQDLGCLAYTCR